MTEHPSLLGRTGDSLLDAWVFSGQANPIRTVVVGAKRVVEAGRHVARLDIGEAFAGIDAEIAGMTEGPLHGKIAYITGGSRGIGRAIALAFAEAGADVAICHLGDAAQAATLVQAVTARGRRGFQMEADVAAPAATRAFAAAAEAALGPCDILVNNAGHQHPRALRDDHGEPTTTGSSTSM